MILSILIARYYYYCQDEKFLVLRKMVVKNKVEFRSRKNSSFLRSILSLVTLPTRNNRDSNVKIGNDGIGAKI